MKKFLYNRLISKIYNIYLNIGFKMQPLEVNENSKFLILAPHPDDESIGCGGLMLKYPKNIKVICLTDGRRGSEKLSQTETVKVRKKEFAQAMEYAQVDSYEMLDIVDKQLVESYDEFEKIEIDDYDCIFIPNILDQHPDHKAVSILLSKLLKQKKHKKDLKIAMYEVWSTLVLPNAYLDIENIKDKKRELISKHISQVQSLDYVSKSLALNSYRSLQVFKQTIEAYSLLDKKIFFNIVKNCIL